MTQPSEPAQPPAPDAERTDAATRDRWRVVRPLGHRDFRVLFGFEVPGVDYAAPVETDVSLETA